MAKQNRKIILAHGAIKELAEKVGCNPLTVRIALDGADNTELRKEIRRIAYEEMGGAYAR